MQNDGIDQNRIDNRKVYADPIHTAQCRYCDKPLVWLNSKVTGKKYPVNWDGQLNVEGRALVMKSDFHNCLFRGNNGKG